MIRWCTITCWLSIALGLVILLPAAAQEVDDRQPYVLSMDSLSASDGTLRLRTPWLYRPGDDPAYAAPTFDDSDWKQASPHLNDGEWAEEWSGIGWFRLHVRTDSTFDGEAVGLQLIQFGAAEVYLNGDLLYQVGEIASSPEETRAQTQHVPHYFTLAPEQDHVLAIRLANDLERFKGILAMKGFLATLNQPDRYLPSLRREIETTTALYLGVIGLFIAFALLHFCLFVAYPSAQENGYFAGIAASLAIAVALGFYIASFASPDDWPLLVIASNSFTLLVYLFTIGLAHTLFYGGVGRIFYGFVGLGVLVLALAIVFSWFDSALVLIALASLELIRTAVVAIYRKRPGAWIVGSGLAAVALGLGVMLLIGLEIIPVFHDYVGFVPIIGVMVLAGAMSVYLSRRIASTNRNLQQQLREVEVLTEKKLEQERRARQEEVQRRLMEEQYRQKVEELEEARALQLSMLPERVPAVEGLEIAAGMKTATEVGGDYYDFKVEPGSCMLAVGDATGHGMRAGTMVTAMKSLFCTLRGDKELVDALRRFSQALKEMQMPMLYMALILARWDGTHLHVVSAGMPPLLVHRPRTGCVEAVRLPGMPLGSFPDFPYERATITLEEGDTALFMTDGIAECFNADHEMFGYDRIPGCFREVATQTPEDIVESMIEAGLDWTGGDEPDDDMTFVVIRRR